MSVALKMDNIIKGPRTSLIGPGEAGEKQTRVKKISSDNPFILGWYFFRPLASVRSSSTCTVFFLWSNISLLRRRRSTGLPYTHHNLYFLQWKDVISPHQPLLVILSSIEMVNSTYTPRVYRDNNLNIKYPIPYSAVQLWETLQLKSLHHTPHPNFMKKIFKNYTVQVQHMRGDWLRSCLEG